MVTNIKQENAEGTQYAATIGSKTWSGIREGSRHWDPLQRAIADGVEVAPFVPYEPSEAEIAQQQLNKTDKEMARVTEDLVSILLSKGIILESDLPQPAKDKIAERQSLRAQI